MYVEGSKGRGSGSSKTFETKLSDIGHETTGFGIFPGRFQPCFGLVFSYYVAIPLLWNGNVYSMLLYLEVYNLLSCFFSN